MNPIIVQIGPLAIRWYGVLLATTIVVSVMVAYRIGPRFGVPAAVLDQITLWLTAALLIGARLGYVISHPGEFQNPVEILRVDHGGLSSHGAIAAGLLYAVWAARRYQISFWALTDVIGWAVPIGNVFVRMGNFINGELYGDPTTLPWGVQFPTAPGPARHPLQLYEMVFAIVILLIARRTAMRRRFEGEVFWTIIVLTSIGRIFLDALRSEDRAIGILTLGQIPAIVLAIWGIVFLLQGRARARIAAHSEAAVGSGR